MSKFQKIKNRQDDSNESLVQILNDPFCYTIKYMEDVEWDVYYLNHFRLYKTIRRK